MNRKEEIAYRQSVMAKTKITKEERQWLLTHPLYNERYDEPVFRFDVINFDPDTVYEVYVKLVNNADGVVAIPVFSVTEGNGEITLTTPLTDIDGNLTDKTSTKIFGAEINNNHRESFFKVRSSLGYMSVGYEFRYFDKTTNISRRESSMGANLGFGMKKQIIADNKVQYNCKSPTNDDFDSLIFSVDWRKI